jgi:hypothetical protein
MPDGQPQKPPIGKPADPTLTTGQPQKPPIGRPS